MTALENPLSPGEKKLDQKVNTRDTKMRVFETDKTYIPEPKKLEEKPFFTAEDLWLRHQARMRFLESQITQRRVDNPGEPEYDPEQSFEPELLKKLGTLFALTYELANLKEKSTHPEQYPEYVKTENEKRLRSIFSQAYSVQEIMPIVKRVHLGDEEKIRIGIAMMVLTKDKTKTNYVTAEHGFRAFVLERIQNRAINLSQFTPEEIELAKENLKERKIEMVADRVVDPEQVETDGSISAIQLDGQKAARLRQELYGIGTSGGGQKKEEKRQDKKSEPAQESKKPEGGFFSNLRNRLGL